MKNGILIMFAVLLISVITFATASSQEDVSYIDTSSFGKTVRGMVPFEHDEHNDNAGLEDCNICHHVYEDGIFMEDESSEDQMCSECHDEDSSGDKPPLRTAFHKNCKGCHLESKAGPVMCGSCHEKN
ncbi:MAG: cytochrome c family protein [Desulfobacterales bacterium]|nr:cytochrome c family protein [Desulfobacterales bacterium]